tara:strand:- start:394 stop:621 length:228 start_codon:yes stop_codon:yes gene_type:complete
MPKKKRKKYNIDGIINGPSHEQGGVIIEVEGDEMVINREATLAMENNPETKGVLEYVNIHGKLPPVFDARKRGKK